MYHQIRTSIRSYWFPVHDFQANFIYTSESFDNNGCTSKYTPITDDVWKTERGVFRLAYWLALYVSKNI